MLLKPMQILAYKQVLLASYGIEKPPQRLALLVKEVNCSSRYELLETDVEANAKILLKHMDF